MPNPNGSSKSVTDYRDPDRQAGGGEPLIKGNSKENKVSEWKPKTNPVEDDFSSSLDHHQVSDNINHSNDIESGKKTKKKTCNAQLVRRRLPIVAWLPTYNWNFSVFDLIAGITVGLTIIPQSIAYAGVAGLPLEYGLYSSFMGLFAYTVFGSVKETSIGPTAVMALMTFSALEASEGGPAYAALLAFLAGLVELVAGLLNLGFMVELISAPVISGFCSAAALTVASTQVKGLFGLKFSGSSFVDIWWGFFTNLSSINRWDTLLGSSTIVVLLLMRKLTSLKDFRLFKKVRCFRNRFVDGTLWFISTSRNAAAVIGGCTAAFLLEANGLTPFTLTGDIKAGLPPIELPPFSINKTDDGNTTVWLSFPEICSELGSAIFLIPLIAILEQIAIAKSFACGKRTDATQEMIALGMGNILGSFFGSMPITASFGRSSVQSACGVKTPLSNIYAGILVILALGFLMPSLAYIPKAILASVIITSVIFMVEFEEVKPMWKSRRLELVPFGVTFFCCLLVNMEYGILIGAGVHLLLLAYMGNRPHPELMRLPGNRITEERVIVKADTNLYFPGVEKFRQALNEAIDGETRGRSSCLLVDLSNVTEIDYSALKMLKSVAADYHKRGLMVLHFVNATPKVARSIASALPSADIAFLPKADDEHEITDEV